MLILIDFEPVSFFRVPEPAQIKFPSWEFQHSFLWLFEWFSVDPFLIDVPILYYLTTPENQKFSGAFRRYKMGVYCGKHQNCFMNHFVNHFMNTKSHNFRLSLSTRFTFSTVRQKLFSATYFKGSYKTQRQKQNYLKWMYFFQILSLYICLRIFGFLRTLT